jgi:hypothetical protein
MHTGTVMSRVVQRSGCYSGTVLQIEDLGVEWKMRERERMPGCGETVLCNRRVVALIVMCVYDIRREA